MTQPCWPTGLPKKMPPASALLLTTISPMIGSIYRPLTLMPVIMTYHLMLHIMPPLQLSQASALAANPNLPTFTWIILVINPIQLLFIYCWYITWTFCPTPWHINWLEVSADIYDFSQCMRLAEYFFDENSNTHTANEHGTPFHNKNTSNPLPLTTEKELLTAF